MVCQEIFEKIFEILIEEEEAAERFLPGLDDGDGDQHHAENE